MKRKQIGYMGFLGTPGLPEAILNEPAYYGLFDLFGMFGYLGILRNKRR